MKIIFATANYVRFPIDQPCAKQIHSTLECINPNRMDVNCHLYGIHCLNTGRFLPFFPVRVWAVVQRLLFVLMVQFMHFAQTKNGCRQHSWSMGDSNLQEVA